MSLRFILTVNSYMCKSESEHASNRFFCQFSNLIKISRLYLCRRNHPGSSTCQNLIFRKIIANIGWIDSTSRHKTDLTIRCCHSFDCFQSACCLCREEFHHIQSIFDCLLNITWAGASRKNRNPFLHTILDCVRIQSRAYNKFCTCFYCLIYLLCIQYSSGSYQHLRISFRHYRNGFFCCICTECNFCTWKSAFAQCFCKRNRILCIIQFDNRKNPHTFNLFQ